MPIKPLIRSWKPHMLTCVTGVRCSRVVVVNSNAGEQQAITYNNRLILNQGYDFQSFFIVLLADSNSRGGRPRRFFAISDI